MYSHCTKKSKITDMMIKEEGCGPDKLSKASRDIWICDIEAGYYTVKVVGGKGKNGKRNNEEEEEETEDDEDDNRDNGDEDDNRDDGDDDA